jgi:hypothetical protein
MSFRLRFLSSFAALLVAATFASAQGTGTMQPPPAGGAGTNPGTTTGGTPAAPANIDLPLSEPAYVGDPAKPDPPPATDGGTDDPRDEPPPTIYGEEIDSETSTIIYVIDVSGSMDMDSQSYTTFEGRRSSGTRMERAKAELMRSISALSRNFKFNCISFDCGTYQWSNGLKEANDGNKASALAWARALRPLGATGTGPATALALGQDRHNKSVVLLTDGAPNCGTPRETMEEHRSMIRNANSQRAAINVFGIAASGSYRSFCQQVAGDSGGSYFDVP